MHPRDSSPSDATQPFGFFRGPPAEDRQRIFIAIAFQLNAPGWPEWSSGSGSGTEMAPLRKPGSLGRGSRTPAVPSPGGRSSTGQYS